MEVFAVYVFDDQINTVNYVEQVLKDICSFTAAGAMTTIKRIEQHGFALIYESRSEEEAWEIHTKIRQRGLISEIKTRVHGEGMPE